MYDQSALRAAQNSLSVIGPPVPDNTADWSSAVGSMSLWVIFLPARTLFCRGQSGRRNVLLRTLLDACWARPRQAGLMGWHLASGIWDPVRRGDSAAGRLRERGDRAVAARFTTDGGLGRGCGGRRWPGWR
jgi:hypothetical protein